TERPIDLFGSSSGGDGARAFLHLKRQAQAVAASEAARRGDKRRDRQIIGLGCWKEHAAGRALIKMDDTAASEDDFGRAIAALQVRLRPRQRLWCLIP